VKKRKANGKEVKVNSKVGTGTEHFLSYSFNVMGVQDTYRMKGHCIFMDNALTHKPKVIKKLIENRGYKCQQ
jgi:hypothetical protein